MAPSLSIELSFVAARAPEQFNAAFSAVHRAHAQALYVIEDPSFFSGRTTLVTLRSRARLPIIYWSKHLAEAGGLMSYGANYSDLMRRPVGYVDKILNSAKPGDLPIEQPTKIDLVINLRSGKSPPADRPTFDPPASRRADPVRVRPKQRINTDPQQQRYALLWAGYARPCRSTSNAHPREFDCRSLEVR